MSELSDLKKEIDFYTTHLKAAQADKNQDLILEYLKILVELRREKNRLEERQGKLY